MTSINDLGTFDQLLWNSLHGELLQTTINPFSISMSRLGVHFDPILIAFVPLYAITPSPEWFALVQALALALSAWPIFLIAEHLFQSQKTAFVWMIIYLMNPFLLSAGAWDFHPVILAIPFMTLGLLAVIRRRFAPLLFACLIMLACKEHLGIAVAGFGILWWWLHREWRIPLALVAIGTVHLLLVLTVIMPYHSPVGTAAMLSEELGQMSRYSWLGNSLSEVLHTLVSQPGDVLQQIINMGAPIYWLLLLMPLAMIFPLLGLPFLLPGIGDLAANSLASNPMPRGIWSYHSALLVPVVTIAAMHGVKRLASWQQRFSARELTGLILTASLITGYIYLPLPLVGSKNLWAPHHVINLPDTDIQSFTKKLDANVSVSAQANIGAHFSQRHEIYMYPHKVGAVDAIVLHLASPTSNITGLPPSASGSRHVYQTWLDGHLQMDRSAYLASIECILNSNQYRIEQWREPWLLLTKNGTQNASPLLHHLSQLKDSWQVGEEEYQKNLDSQRDNLQRHGSCLPSE